VHLRENVEIADGFVWEATSLWLILKENVEIKDGFVSLFFQLLEKLPHQQLLTFFHDVMVHMEEEECQDMEQYQYEPTHVCPHGAGRIAAMAVGS